MRSGGKERRLLYLAKELGDRGFKVTVIVLSPEIFYSLDGFSPNVKFLINRKETGRVSFLYFNIFTLLTCRYILCWGNYPSLLLAPLGVLGMCRIWNCSITNVNPLESKGYRFAFLYSQYIIANSFAGARAYGVSKDPRLRVIYNGVYKKSKVGRVASAAPFHFVMLASYSNKKAHVDLINAVATFPRDFLQTIRIDFYGDGEVSHLVELIGSFGLSEIIMLHDKVSDVDAVLAKADYGLLATYGEGISNFILESLSHGLPVIATACGGVNEVLTEGINGCLVEANSPSNWLEGFKRLLAYEYTDLSQNSIKSIENKFGMERMINDYLKLL